jgi:hypothetical protein
MSQRLLSVSISDFALASAAAWCCMSLSDVSFISHGFFFTAVAAALGTVRFALADPPVALIAVHEVFAFAVPTIGFPLLAVGARALPPLSAAWPLSAAQSIAVLDVAMLAVWFLSPTRVVREVYRVAMSVCSLVLLVLAVRGAWTGVALQIVAAGVGAVGVIRVSKSIQILRVDVFHYVTAISQIAIALAIHAHRNVNQQQQQT